MAKVKTTGLTELLKELEKLEANTDEILDEVTLEGAGVVADVMRAQIRSLKTSDEYEGGNGKRYAKPEDIKGLLDSLGYTPTQFKGTKIDSNVGFDGYNSNKTAKYPNGHANRMIANAINKGTSFMIAQPFISRSKRQAEKEAIDQMEKSLDEAVKKYVK